MTSLKTDSSGRRAWLYDHVDLPQVINALAAVQIIQHHAFGRTYHFGRGSAYLDTVTASVLYPWAAGNQLAVAIWVDPVLREMFDRRVRTLTDELLGPEPIESRVAALGALVAADAARDRQAWGTYNEPQSPASAQNQGRPVLGAKELGALRRCARREVV